MSETFIEIMHRVTKFFSRLFHEISEGLRHLTRHELMVIAGTVIGVAAIIWLSVSMAEEEFDISEKVDPAFAAYVSGYTAGVISTESSVQIRLTQPVIDSAQVGQEAPGNLFKFDPATSGKAYWKDQQTIEFLPDNALRPGTLYEVRFALDEVMEVSGDLENFDFSLLTMEQNYDVELAGLVSYDTAALSMHKLMGTVLTADFAQASVIEDMLHAEQEGNPLPITWDHQDSHIHHFSVENIARKDSTVQVLLTSRGAPINVNKSKEFTVEVPPLGTFTLLSTKTREEPEQYVELRFSDPLQENQSLEGLIQLGNEKSELKFIVDNNVIQVYPASRLSGPATVTIHEGIRNIEGEKLDKDTEADINFEAVKPAVRLVHKGVILPSTDGLVLPFEAVGLKAVDVTVVKVFEENMAQFLQVNPYDGAQELRRVGRPVAQQPIPLNASGVTDLHKWNRFTLDLSNIMETDPGAMYQVNISFRKSQSVYACVGDASQEPDEMEDFDIAENWDDPAKMYWDAYSDYYYAPDFDWEQRENPCAASYYGYFRSAQKNLIASDLGIIAQRGQQDELQVIVTDLLSTSPKFGVKVRILDFQHRELANGTTDANGKLTVPLDHNPFLLVAEVGAQRGYLRLDDGNALPVSHFDVSGQEVKSGLKGFIYGDRGVWRPGDSLHLNFILEDQAQTLPEHHPVIFELKNPRGQVTQHIVRNTPVGSIYNFSTATEADALTGRWLASVQVGGATFTKEINIETIKPNRLKIDLDFGTDQLTAQDKSVTGTLDVSWLSGATARNLKAQYDLILTQGNTTFEDYPDYVFEDEARTFEVERKEVFNGQLNEVGEVSFPVNLSIGSQVPGVLNAIFTGKVFEGGGNFSTDQVSLPYYPYTAFVGLQVPEGEGIQGALLTGESHAVNIVTVDAEGKLMTDRTVEAELYQLDWRWWWDESDNNISNYLGSEDRKPVSQEEIRLAEGKGKWTFSVDEQAWGRYYLRVCDPASGHCAGQVIYLDWPGYAGRDDRQDPKAATMLSFSAGKETYQVGEEATIHIPGGRQGRALVSLEDGNQVLESHWVVLEEQGETAFTFEVTEAMAPNIYVHVTLLQPHAQTTNDLPIRLYGIIPLAIEDPGTVLEPLITLPEKIAPEAKVTIKVSEKNEKPMAYTLAMVDEGLLDITDFKTPEPHEYFYAREALGVKTWDLYDYVIGAYGGDLERLLSVGGGETGEISGQQSANRFKPVVKFMGPFFLEEGEEDVLTFTMPNYVGAVRTMVVAAHEGAYGKAEVSTKVSQPLMVLGTLPRVLSPQESVLLPVDVFVMENSVRNVRVGVSTNALLTVAGKSSEEMFFENTGDRVVNFNVKVPNQTGVGTVQINAAAGRERAAYAIEIGIRNPNPPQVDAISTLIEPGESWNAGFTPIGMPGTRSAVLEISSIPPLNLNGRLPYLINYPHGCVEQVVSAAFPQLFLTNIAPLSEEEKNRIENHVKAALKRLGAFQTNEGAFAYWPGSNDADEWATSYAGHFMLKAREAGYEVSNGLLQAWRSYQARRAVRWGRSTGYIRDDLIQAYRLYTLALAGDAEQGAMNRMREKSGLTLPAQWRLAAAYALIGQQEVAENIIAGLEEEVPAYKETYGTYGSDLRDEAMILETLALLQRREQGLTLFRQISSALSNENRWLSTQTTAYCLIAAAEFMKGKPFSGNINASYAFHNQSAVNVQSELSVVQREIPLSEDNRQRVQVTNQGEGELYTRIVLRGTPPIGEERAKENGLRLQVVYKGTDGTVINPASLPQGTDFVAEVTIYNPGLQGDYRQLALTQIIPSGWEIINTRLQNLDQFFAQDVPAYQDIRDDRVYTYFDLAANERKTFKVLLNATYAGHFYQPAIDCEAMYDNTINASTSGQWIDVVQPE